MKVKIGQLVSDIKITATGDQEIVLSNQRGKNIVLYFYPKDNTPGCTQESKDFSDNFSKFKRAGTVVFGVSRDTLKSHENFKEKFDLPFDLLADVDEQLCEQFDVIKMKNMYGKKVRGIVRSTFLIDKEGVLQNEWRNVKVANHVEEVLQTAKSLV